MATRRHDVVVIGGGPGGAAVATLCAKAGHDVAVFERQTFPRFQVGESLIPAANLTLERLGVLEQMDAHGFPRKHGVQFFSAKGPTRPFYFSEVEDPRMHTTWQVLRSDFDAMLLQCAASAGVQVSTETDVFDVCQVDEVVTGVRIRSATGVEETIGSRVVVDASGQQGLLVRRFGGRTILKGLENAAVYSHYADAKRDAGIDAGSTLIYRIDGESWLWFIPLPDTVSVGLVTPARKLTTFGGSREEILDNAIAASEPLSARLDGAKRTIDVLAARDYSYRTWRDGGRGWILVGDALGFIDPIYSTGLYLTMFSAELASSAITAALGDAATPDFAGFSGKYQTAFDQFLVLVQAFYRADVRFSELVKNPDHRRGLVDMLTGITTTPQAVDVTNALRASFGEETPAMMPGPPVQRPRTP
ncbi:MAG: NAD(P)/FAD-dependent oxidoreductase [Planctomycetota bacterium]